VAEAARSLDLAQEAAAESARCLETLISELHCLAGEATS
jgi:hypothetical protein